jgi:hypothetical protein
MMVIKHGHDVIFPGEFLVASSANFWDDLKECEKVIRPLCIASFVLQRDHTTMADVLNIHGDDL